MARPMRPMVRPPMARSRRDLEARRRLVRAATIGGSVVLLVALFVVSGLGRSDGSRTGASASPSGIGRTAGGASIAGPPTAAAVASPATPLPVPSSSPTPEATPAPTEGPSATPFVPLEPDPSPTPVATPIPTPSPTPSPPPGSAPTGPDGFSLRFTIVQIGFPLARTAAYHYRNNFLEGRDGQPEPYNHWFSKYRGIIRRAHDGIDIYARKGQPILAPVSGTIIDPATRWEPWRPDRYGRTVAIISDEPTSVGYAVLMAHMDTISVKPGSHVERGQKVGTVGNTGNADGGPTHIHFELRAPFTFRVKELGTWRQIDAFNAFPSLRRADPHYHGSVTGTGLAAATVPAPIGSTSTIVIWQVL